MSLTGSNKLTIQVDIGTVEVADVDSKSPITATISFENIFVCVWLTVSKF